MQISRYKIRFNAQEIQELVTALDIPEVIITEHRYRATGVEALCLLLARFRSSGEMFYLTLLYCRSMCAISEIVKEICQDIHETWTHLLDFDHAGLLKTENLVRYSEAVATIAPHDPIAFIDCTIRQIARPSLYQRVVYNGHKKMHALKFQALTTPDGMIAHLWGPVEGRRADPHLLKESQLLEKLQAYAMRPGATEETPIINRYFQIFGDPAYGVSPVILSPFSRAGEYSQEERRWNAGMASARIEVEHAFGIVVNTWPFLNCHWRMKLYASPIGLYYRVAVLLTNARNCLHPNQISQKFNCQPPNIHEYFYQHDED